MKILLLGLILTGLSACGNNDNSKGFDKRVRLGQAVFEANCVACHGVAGQGLTKDWKKPLSNGKYPPPPLNGTAHTWHHSPEILLKIINNGGVALGGVMPAFKDKLNAKEKQALLDYIYNLWPKDIQNKYDNRFKR